MNSSRRPYASVYLAYARAIGGSVGQYLGRGDVRLTLTASAILLGGVVLRTWHFASGRSLWFDEAMVATSIVGRDWTGLLQPLDYLQLAPIGWLFVEKASLEAIGGLEYALRLPQFLFGLASLAMFVIVARRMLGQAGFIAAIAIFALESKLIYYGAEVKPYAVDVFFSAIFLLFGTRYFADKAPLTVPGIAALAITGTAAAACSFPSIIVMASFGVLIFLREILHRRFVTSAAVAVVGALWLAVFTWFFLGFEKSNTPVLEDMTKQWDGGFAPLLPTTFADLKWYATTTSDFFEYVFGKTSTIVAICCALIGVWALLRKERWFAAALLLPFVVALLVSGLQLYPISNRATLYLLPMLILLVAAGVEASISAIRPKIAATSVALALVLAGTAIALWQNFANFPQPYASENIRPLLEEVASRKTGSQAIYVDRLALPAFRLYQNRAGLGDATVIEGKFKRGDLGCLLVDIDSIRHHDQIWVVYSHSDQHIWNQPEEVLFMYFAQVIGREVLALHSFSVHAFLVDFETPRVDLFAPLMRALPPKISCE